MRYIEVCVEELCFGDIIEVWIYEVVFVDVWVIEEVDVEVDEFVFIGELLLVIK